MADCVCVCGHSVLLELPLGTSAAISRNSPTSGGSGGIVWSSSKLPEGHPAKKAEDRLQTEFVFKFL